MLLRMAKKPHNNALADQLKTVTAKLAKDKAAQDAAEQAAKARLALEASQKQRAAEGNVDDDTRFLKAVGAFGRDDVGRKFDDVPDHSRAVAAKPTEKPKKEEEVFLDAMATMDRVFEAKKKK
jgi:hypothetical protein